MRNKGQKHSEETKAKISASNKGKKKPADFSDKLRAVAEQRCIVALKEKLENKEWNYLFIDNNLLLSNKNAVEKIVLKNKTIIEHVIKMLGIDINKVNI